MPDGARKVMEAFKSHFANPDVKIPTSLRSEPPDVIYTGLLEPEEVRAPELMDVMPPSEALPDLDPMGVEPTTLDAALPADNPFGDVELADVLTF